MKHLLLLKFSIFKTNLLCIKVKVEKTFIIKIY